MARVSSPPRRALLAGAFAGCAGAPHRRDPPPAAAVPDAPPNQLHAPAHVPQTYAVEQPCDLVVPQALGVVRQQVWGSGRCVGSHCTYAHLQPTELLRLSAEQSVSETAQALPLPPAEPIASGQTLELTLQPVAPGDPRGPLADVQLSLDAPARITLDWRTVGGAEPSRRPHFVQAQLYGPRGAVSAHVHGQHEADPTHRSNTWDLEAGSYTLRITPWDELGGMLCDPPAFPGLPPPPAPDWCGRETDDRAPQVVLAWTERHERSLEGPADREAATPAPTPLPLPLGETALQAGPPPAPSARSYTVEPGEDVVARWTPAEVPLAYSWEVDTDHWSRGGCDAGACRFHAVPFSSLELQLHPGPTDRTVSLEVHRLAPPPPAFELPPGYVAETRLARVTPDDPRGPLVDFLAAFPEPGRYRVGVGWAVGEPRPHVVSLSRGDGLQNTLLELMGGHGGYDAEFYDVTEPGLYPFRVLSCADCDEQSVEVEVQVEE